MKKLIHIFHTFKIKLHKNFEITRSLFKHKSIRFVHFSHILSSEYSKHVTITQSRVKLISILVLRIYRVGCKFWYSLPPPFTPSTGWMTNFKWKGFSSGLFTNTHTITAIRNLFLVKLWYLLASLVLCPGGWTWVFWLGPVRPWSWGKLCGERKCGGGKKKGKENRNVRGRMKISWK